MTNSIKEIHTTLKNFVDTFAPHWDCDGCTRFVGIMLDSLNVKYKIYAGSIFDIKNTKNTFPIHFWIKTKDGTIFDFKAQKWLKIPQEQVRYTYLGIVTKSWLTLNTTKDVILSTLITNMQKNDKNAFILTIPK
jgi:hypothetical protein|tara:strand:- start:10878 stop:11279 length:402 start_codon:yes stop_codon:yes gene_type:complete